VTGAASRTERRAMGRICGRGFRRHIARHNMVSREVCRPAHHSIGTLTALVGADANYLARRSGAAHTGKKLLQSRSHGHAFLAHRLAKLPSVPTSQEFPALSTSRNRATKFCLVNGF